MPLKSSGSGDPVAVVASDAVGAGALDPSSENV